MRAIVQDKYGAAAEVLSFVEMDKPEITDDQVLVRVHAASIHIGDSHMVKGVPRAMRPIFSKSMAKNGVPGSDIAGTVAAVGKDITHLQPGDEVFGWGRGAFAEYTATSGTSLALKPADFTFEQAATVGTSAFTALQGLRDEGNLQQGQSVLVTGASGGVGTFAVQIGKSLGAEVTGVCSTRNIDMVRSLGADHVIDYTQDDFTQGDQRYDLIFDNVGNHSLSETRRALKPDGLLLANGASVSGWFGGLGHFMTAAAASIFVKAQGRPFLAVSNKDDLDTLKQLAETGALVPVIDRTYPLSETPEAISYVGEGHSQGKTVIQIVTPDSGEGTE